MAVSMWLSLGYLQLCVVFLENLHANRILLTTFQIPRPVEKRAAAIAITTMVGNFAQIYSPYLYPSSSGPRYLPAMTANSKRRPFYCLPINANQSGVSKLLAAMFVFVSICLAILLRFCLVRENRKLDTIEGRREEDGISSPKIESGEITQQGSSAIVLLSPGFRYII